MHTEGGVVDDVVYAPANAFVDKLLVVQFVPQLLDRDLDGHRAEKGGECTGNKVVRVSIVSYGWKEVGRLPESARKRRGIRYR